jgi:hypothetical protein
MALFDFLKKKEGGKEPQHPGMPPPPPPSQTVQSMQHQGFSDNQIAQSMQQDGHDLDSINDAFAQSRTQDQLGPHTFDAPERFQPPKPAGISREQAEEIAESIIEEKFRDMQQQLAKMDEWKGQVTSRVDKIDQSITDMKADLANLHKAIVSKIGEYDKNLLAVGTEIKAMEKVFEKILPTLTENVSELSRITKKAKK